MHHRTVDILGPTLSFQSQVGKFLLRSGFLSFLSILGLSLSTMSDSRCSIEVVKLVLQYSFCGQPDSF